MKTNIAGAAEQTRHARSQRKSENSEPADPIAAAAQAKKAREGQSFFPAVGHRSYFGGLTRFQ